MSAVPLDFKRKKCDDNIIMEVQQISDIEQIKEIYQTRMQEDFPANELFPFSAMRRLWTEGKYQGYGLFEDNSLFGYALFFIMRSGDQNDYLLDYLAVAKEHRDKGLGSFFLQELLKLLNDASCIIIEAEDPDKAENNKDRVIREKRIEFYLKNGCTQTAVISNVDGADYRLLELRTDHPHSSEMIKVIYTRIYEHMAPEWYIKKHFNVQIPQYS